VRVAVGSIEGKYIAMTLSSVSRVDSSKAGRVIIIKNN